MELTLNKCLAVCLLAAAGSATAQVCPSGTARVFNGTPSAPNSGAGTFQTFIAGTTVCVARGAERWQEYHAAGGDLIDYKRGPNHPVDPTKKVGTWSITGAQMLDPRSARPARGEGPVLVHTYGSTSYGFAVCVPMAEMRRSDPSFVLSSPVAGTFQNVRILAGQVPCPN
jgi:hypothetical protein